eukprot:Selendium_serpulae@DN3852_c0_g1_i1.p1
MVYIEKFSEFQAAARTLLIEHPRTTRYQIKVRRCEGRVVAKVTNDKVCLKYKARHRTDTKKLEKLTHLAMVIMTTKISALNELEDTAVAPEGGSAKDMKKKLKKKGLQ